MRKHPLPLVLATIILCMSSWSFAGPCGTYFNPGYRAVDKIRPFPTSDISTLVNHFELWDWTNDGRSDFYNFRYNPSTQKQDVIIYPASPSGYWDWDNPIVISTPFTLEQISSAGAGTRRLLDFNGDGKPDFVRSSSTTGQHTVEVNLNNGSAILPAAVSSFSFPSDNFINEISYSDLSGDGIVDYVYVQRNSTTGDQALGFALGNPDGTLSSATQVLIGSDQNNFIDSQRRVADFDGDGKLDILYVKNVPGTSTIRVLKNMGNGAFALSDSRTVPIFSLQATTVDLNGDGRADFIVDRGDSFTVYFGQTDLSFTTATYPKSVASSFMLFGTRDFNGDGRRDILYWGDSNFEIFFVNADGSLTSVNYPVGVPTARRFRSTFEDFNNDGKADWFEGALDSRPFNLFGEEVLVIKESGCSPVNVPRFANFDGNTQSDILAWNGPSGLWKWGNANFNPLSSTPITSFNWGSTSIGDVPAPGDFDGDGKTDYTVYRDGEGKWYTILSSTGAWSVFHFGAPGDIPIPNDYNGGGKTDYAVFRPSDGHWYIWFTETNQFVAHHWGQNGDRPVPADYDGDGKTDLGVFRPSDGVWYYVPSHDWSYAALAWGISTDIPLPADYDGDGRADVAVFRSGIWYILRSYNGAVGTLNWGASTDIPIPVGQLGDIAFPTVYRPSDTKWYRFNLGPGFALPNGGTPIYYGLPNN